MEQEGKGWKVLKREEGEHAVFFLKHEQLTFFLSMGPHHTCSQAPPSLGWQKRGTRKGYQEGSTGAQALQSQSWAWRKIPPHTNHEILGKLLSPEPSSSMYKTETTVTAEPHRVEVYYYHHWYFSVFLPMIAPSSLSLAFPPPSLETVKCKGDGWEKALPSCSLGSTTEYA